MARYYAEIQGNRGEATRMGTPQSGIHGHVRGWGIGALVTMNVNNATDEDMCHVTITGGSNGGGDGLFLGTFVRRDGKVVKVG